MVSNDWCSELHDKTLPVTDSKVCAGGRKDQGVCEVSFINITLHYLKHALTRHCVTQLLLQVSRISTIMPFDWLHEHHANLLLVRPSERLRWPVGVPGAREQSHRGREHPRPGLRPGPAARHLRQCGLLLGVDP